MIYSNNRLVIALFFVHCSPMYWFIFCLLWKKLAGLRINTLGFPIICMVVTYLKQSIMHEPGKVANTGRGQLNRENELFPVPVRAEEFGLARRIRPSRPASNTTIVVVCCLKNNQNAPRTSEHPPVRGKKCQNV